MKKLSRFTNTLQFRIYTALIFCVGAGLILLRAFMPDQQVSKVQKIIHDQASLLSLSMSVPTILLACLVVYRFGPRAYESFWRWKDDRRALHENDYLIAGIVVSFVGSAIDNSYWFVAWACDFLDLNERNWWFNNGVFNNIPFRQFTGIVGACFHLIAATSVLSRRIWLEAIIVSFVTTLIALISIKYL